MLEVGEVNHIFIYMMKPVESLAWRASEASKFSPMSLARFKLIQVNMQARMGPVLHLIELP